MKQAAAVRTQFSLNNRAGSTATSTATVAANLVSEAATPSSSAVATRGTSFFRGRGRRGSHSPGHPYRLNSPKVSLKESLKSYNVWLLDSTSFENDEFGNVNEVAFNDDVVIMKGYVSISNNDTEQIIREKRCELFKQKITNIEPSGFFYVKRERNKLIYPETVKNYAWNYTNLKLLAGQGKLYCSLKRSYRSYIFKTYISLLIPQLIFCQILNLVLISYLHHQIIYANINIKIYYPPPYERLVQDYSKAELEDLNVNDQVEYLSGCILNI